MTLSKVRDPDGKLMYKVQSIGEMAKLHFGKVDDVCPREYGSCYYFDSWSNEEVESSRI